MDDRLAADVVEFVVDNTGKVWVNIDGLCVLRVGHAKTITCDSMLGDETLYSDEPNLSDLC